MSAPTAGRFRYRENERDPHKKVLWRWRAVVVSLVMLLVAVLTGSVAIG
ncbi:MULTISPECIES: hypothetical protein [Labedella]|nr:MULTISPECIES: hypothetical protein [Labedella]